MHSTRLKENLSKKIKHLKKVRKKLRKDEARLNQLKIETQQYYSVNKFADTKKFDDLRRRTIKYNAKKVDVLQSLRSLELFSALLRSEKDPQFGRIIIGGGVAGTLVFTELPRELHIRSENIDVFPPVIVLNDPVISNTWPKEKNRLMGQRSDVQTPQVFSSHPDDFIIDEQRQNPYDYTIASDFTKSLVETQHDLNMGILNLAALRIESKDTVTTKEPQWEYANSRYRIAVNVGNKVRYLYTNFIDLCTGLGAINRLSDKQIDPILAKKLIHEHKLVYAQDGEIALENDVIFYGGSAINAALIAEMMLAGSHPKAAIQCWVSRTGKSFEDARLLNRIIQSSYESNKIRMVVGSIEKIEEDSQQKLSVSFTAPEENVSGYKDFTGVKISCDHLVLAIGQQPYKLTKPLNDFVPCVYKDKYSNITIPLGTHSKDGSIVAWGAAGITGIGLTPDKRNEITTQIAKHVATLPQECRALSGIFRASFTINKMATRLRENGLFPVSVNSTKKMQHAHHLDVPNINLATVDELMDIIESADNSLKKDECEQLAKKIIDMRSRNLDTASIEPTGAQSIAQLEAILPAQVLMKIHHHYFPLETLSSQYISKLKVPVKTSLPKPKLLSWLGERKTSDANVFVSNVTNKGKDKVSNILVNPTNVRKTLRA